MRNRRSALSSAAAVMWCLGRWALALAGLGGAIATPAWAKNCPPPQTLAHCTVSPGGVVLDDPASCTLGGFDTSSVSVSLTPFVSLSAQAASPAALGTHGAGADGFATYSFQVVGGN